MNLRRVTRIVLLSAAVVCLSRPVLAQPAPTQIPWNVARLGQCPEFEWIDQTEPVHSLFYVGEAYRGMPTRVFAFYASPSTLIAETERKGATAQQKFPTMVLIHGGGGTAFREWAELWAKRGYAAIAMDLAGDRPVAGTNAHQPENREHLDDGGPGQGDDEKFGSIDKEPEEQWSYHAVANAILAHSLVRSFEEVDAERTGVTGISWGGYLTCIVAGIDSRFKVAVPVYGCGFLQENSAWLPRFASMTPAQRERWVELWDPSRYLPQVTMPILFVNGTNDFAYPLDSYMKSFALVPDDEGFRKQLCITVNMPHSHTDGWAPPEIGLFVDQYLKQGRPLPQLGEPQIDSGKLAIAVKSPQPIASAKLHYTEQTTAINERQWNSVAATVEGERVIATIPPAEATAWFVTVDDDRGATISTRVVFVP